MSKENIYQTGPYPIFFEKSYNTAENRLEFSPEEFYEFYDDLQSRAGSHEVMRLFIQYAISAIRKLEDENMEDVKDRKNLKFGIHLLNDDDKVASIEFIDMLTDVIAEINEQEVVIDDLSLANYKITDKEQNGKSKQITLSQHSAENIFRQIDRGNLLSLDLSNFALEHGDKTDYIKRIIIRNSPQLKILSISENNLNDADGRKILAVIPPQCHLGIFEYDDNDFSQEVLDELDRAEFNENEDENIEPEQSATYMVSKSESEESESLSDEEFSTTVETIKFTSFADMNASNPGTQIKSPTSPTAQRSKTKKR